MVTIIKPVRFNMSIDNFLEVRLVKDDDFLLIKETLTRIGIASKKDKTLFQSCHILHKQGKFYIVHFKEMFILDGRPSTFSDEDKVRRNTITALLVEWGLVEIVNLEQHKDVGPINQIKVLSYKEKNDWNLVAKYSIGKKR
jgi:hypothetical protein